MVSLERLKNGRQCKTSFCIVDAQSVKNTDTAQEKGYDAGKKINGRKRHIIVDTIGLILVVVVHTANIQDRDGAKLVMARIRGKFARLRLIWADGGYQGKLRLYVSHGIFSKGLDGFTDFNSVHAMNIMNLSYEDFQKFNDRNEGE